MPVHNTILYVHYENQKLLKVLFIQILFHIGFLLIIWVCSFKIEVVISFYFVKISHLIFILLGRYRQGMETLESKINK